LKLEQESEPDFILLETGPRTEFAVFFRWIAGSITGTEIFEKKKKNLKQG